MEYSLMQSAVPSKYFSQMYSSSAESRGFFLKAGEASTDCNARCSSANRPDPEIVTFVAMALHFSRSGPKHGWHVRSRFKSHYRSSRERLDPPGIGPFISFWLRRLLPL